MKKFYLVYSIDYNKAFGTFSTIDEAIKYAEKLAEENIGREYYVCSGLYRYSSIATTIIEPQCFILGD
jgi:hypothetical protein